MQHVALENNVIRLYIGLMLAAVFNKSITTMMMCRSAHAAQPGPVRVQWAMWLPAQV